MISFIACSLLFLFGLDFNNPLFFIASALFAISGNICMEKDELASFNQHLTDKLKDVARYIKHN